MSKGICRRAWARVAIGMGAGLSIAMAQGCDLIVGIVTVEGGPSSDSSMTSGTGGGGGGGGIGGSASSSSGAGGGGGGGGTAGGGGSAGAGGVLAPTHVWSNRYGGVGRQNVASIDIDKMDDIVIAGTFAGVLPFDPLPPLQAASQVTEVFVAKLDGSDPMIGEGLWSLQSMTVMGNGTVTIADVAVDPTSAEFVVIGSFTGTTILPGCNQVTSSGLSDVFVMKLDAAGTCLWSQPFGSPGNDNGAGVIVDMDGNIYATGYLNGPITFGAAMMPHVDKSDVFVVKLNPSGMPEASTTLGGMDEQKSYGIAVHQATQAVFVAGACKGMVDPMDALTTCDGDYDVFAARLSMSDLAKVWIKRFGDAGLQQPWSIAATKAGDMVMTGQFASNLQFDGAPALMTAGDTSGFVAKLSGQGAHLWSFGFGDDKAQEGRGVAVDSTDNILLVGGFSGDVELGCGLHNGKGGDVLWGKLAPDMTCIWSGSAGNVVPQKGYGVAVDGSDNVFITGEMQGTIDFGGNPLSAAGGDIGDIFIAKFAP